MKSTDGVKNIGIYSHYELVAFWKKMFYFAPVSNPLLKDNRTMISELPDACEMNFDNPEEARRQLQIRVEWNDASQNGLLSDINRGGLEARAFRLLTCNDKEWLEWLDNLDFWEARLGLGH